MEISKQKPVNSFPPKDSIREVVGFIAVTIYEEDNLSLNPVDILSFDNIFLGADISQAMICKGKRSEKLHNFTMDVDVGFKYIE